MNELIKAAKAVIEKWDLIKPDQVPAYIKELHAAMERAENPPTDYNEWTARHSGQTVSPYELWTDATQAERERIKDIIKTVGVQCDNGTLVKCETIMEKIHDVS